MDGSFDEFHISAIYFCKTEKNGSFACLSLSRDAQWLQAREE
jgi:hypothetical protein